MEGAGSPAPSGAPPGVSGSGEGVGTGGEQRGNLSINKVRESTQQLASLLSEIKSLRRNASTYSTPGVGMGPPTPVSVAGESPTFGQRSHVLHSRSLSMPDAAVGAMGPPTGPVVERPTAPMFAESDEDKDQLQRDIKAGDNDDKGEARHKDKDQDDGNVKSGDEQRLDSAYLAPKGHTRDRSGVSMASSYSAHSVGEARMEEFAAQGSPDLVSSSIAGGRPTPPPALQPPSRRPREEVRTPPVPVLPQPPISSTALEDEMSTFLYPPRQRTSDPLRPPSVPFGDAPAATNSSADSFRTARSRTSEEEDSEEHDDTLETISGRPRVLDVWPGAGSVDATDASRDTLSHTSSSNTVKPMASIAGGASLSTQPSHPSLGDQTQPLRVRASALEVSSGSRSSSSPLPHAYTDEQRQWLPEGAEDSASQPARPTRTTVSNSDTSADVSLDSQELLGVGGTATTKQYHPHMSPVAEESRRSESQTQTQSQHTPKHRHHRHKHHRSDCSHSHRRVRSQTAADMRNSATAPSLDLYRASHASSHRSAFSQPNVQRLLSLADQTLRLEEIDLPPEERHLLEKFVDALSKLSVEINVDDGKRIEGKRRLHNALRAIEGWI